jgi:hypothetical protein
MDKSKRLSLICLGIAVVACGFTAVFVGNSGADVMGAAILTIYIGLPVLSIVLGAVLGYRNGFLFFLFPFVLALLEWFATGIAFGYLDLSGLALIAIFTLFPGAVATAIGYAKYRFDESQKD